MHFIVARQTKPNKTKQNKTKQNKTKQIPDVYFFRVSFKRQF